MKDFGKDVLLALPHAGHVLDTRDSRRDPDVRHKIVEEDGWPCRTCASPQGHVGVVSLSTGKMMAGVSHLGLLHKALDLAGLVHDHDAILGGVLHLGHQDGPLCARLLVEGQHLLEREIADDVTAHGRGAILADVCGGPL